MAGVQDIIAYGFGPWSTVAKLPTLGFGIRAAVSRGAWVVAAKDIRATGPVAADIRPAGPVVGDVRGAGDVAASIEPT